MFENKIILTILGVLIVLIILLIVLNATKKGSKKLISVLKKFAGIRSFKVINNLKLPSKDDTYVVIDHILIGFFGMLVLKRYDFGGTVYGDIRDKEWISVTTKDNIDKKIRFKNPVIANQEATEAIRKVFQKENIYKIDIENYAVFTNNNVQLSLLPNVPAMTLKAFKKLISHSKYSDNGPVDVKKVYDALINNAE